LMLVQVETEGTADLVLLGVADERTVRLPADMPDTEARERFFAALVRTAPEVALPLGRRHPLVREAVADHLIRDTSRVNAEFAALASLPANIPLFGGIVGGMADIIVLTKNQVLLILKLAGLYGHDLELSRELIIEVMPVVGSAFVWRTTARTLVGFVPPVLGLVPKAIIAYGGTFVIGETARYFYRFGRSPHPDLVKDLRAEGQRLALEALNKLRR
jgi:uncharacterized protein (DUF697 family)